MSNKPSLSNATEKDIRDAFLTLEKRLKPRPCALCSQVFKPTRMWQRFHDESCRVMWHRLKRSVENAAKEPTK